MSQLHSFPENLGEDKTAHSRKYGQEGNGKVEPEVVGAGIKIKKAGNGRDKTESGNDPEMMDISMIEGLQTGNGAGHFDNSLDN